MPQQADLSPVETVQAESAPDTYRVSEQLSENWKFAFDSSKNADCSIVNYDDSAWQNICIPHTWNALDGQDGGSNYQRGAGWYRTSIPWKAEYSGKQLYLEFLGASLKTDVYLNGNHVGEHKGGYTTFHFNITQYLSTGSNTLAVKVDNSYNESIIPLSGDFTVFGGLYREVNLIAASPLHVDLKDMGSSGLYLTTSDVSQQSAKLKIKASITNESNDANLVTLCAELKKPDSFDAIAEVAHPLFDLNAMKPGGSIQIVEETVTIPAGENYSFEKDITVEDPHLWNGMQDPFRYLVVLDVKEGGNTIDRVQDYVGFRYFSVDKNKGFFLNGQPYPLRGVNRHQDRKDKGYALTQAEHNQDFGLIYEMGANTLRLAHYPQAPYFYELCDRYGIVVWAEIPFVDQVGKAADFYQTTENQLMEMIRQNYNRPGIFFWGLQNEVGNGGRPSDGMDWIMQNLNDKAHAEDPSRLTTQATNGNSSWKSDLIAWNTYPGWYGGSSEKLGSVMDGKSRRPVGISEYGAGANLQHHEIPPAQPSAGGSWHPEEYQTKLHEDAIKSVSSRQYLWGTYVWNMFDFASDWRNEGEQPGINDKGLVSHDRSTPKDSFYLYKANWNQNDYFVHIASKRFNPRNGETISSFKVYSNCEKVSLTVNGIEIGTVQNNGFGIFEWKNVPLGKQENTVVATGEKLGGQYEDNAVFSREKSSSTLLVSDILGVNSEKKTIGLPGSYTLAEIKKILSGLAGAVYTVVMPDGITPVDENEHITPGMKALVTSEDESRQDTYTFSSLHLSGMKTVKASGAEEYNNPQNAADCNSQTRWAAASSSMPQWIELDLEQEYFLTGLGVEWFNPDNFKRSYQYKVETSLDGKTYREVIDRSRNTREGLVDDPLFGVEARYIKIQVIGSSAANTNASIWEVVVHGWKMHSSVYEINHKTRVIKVPPQKGLLTNEEFLLNIDIEGDCSFILEGQDQSYFVKEGDYIAITDTSGRRLTYVIDLADGTEQSGIVSLNRPVYVSGQEGVASDSSLTLGSCINDNDESTRWAAPLYKLASGPSSGIQGQGGFAYYPEWVEIDLEQLCSISQIDIVFYKHGQNERAYRYELYASSTDRSDAAYIKIADETANSDKSGRYHHSFAEGIKARYLKVKVTGCSNTETWAAASIYELTATGKSLEETIPMTGIKFSSQKLELISGTQQKLEYKLLPENTTQSALVWESSNPEVATVLNGKISAVKPGIAVIQATEAFEGTVKARFDVKVYGKNEYAVTVLRGNSPVSAAREGQTVHIQAEPAPSGKTFDVWQGDGVVFNQSNSLGTWFIMPGKPVTVEAMYRENNTYQPSPSTPENPPASSKAPSASEKPDQPLVRVKSIQLNMAEKVLKTGAGVTLKVTAIHPANASNRSIIWKSSNPKVASVKNGRVKAVKPGKATITATMDGKKAGCRVIVQKAQQAKKNAVNKLKLSKTSIILYAKKGKKAPVSVVLKPKFTPATAKNKSVTWESSNPKVAYVNSKGKITARSPGIAAITCTSKEGGKKAVCKVRVK